MIFWSNQCVFQEGENVDVICFLKGHIDFIRMHFIIVCCSNIVFINYGSKLVN